MNKLLKARVRELGYQLAVREIYGENTPEYFKLKRTHDNMLDKLYRLEKKGWQIPNKFYFSIDHYPVLPMCETGFFCKSMIINNLWKPGSRKSLIYNNLRQSEN